jgi:hypothetical protein
MVVILAHQITGGFCQCLVRDRFVTQLCLQIWSGGMLVLLASPLSDDILTQLACPLSDIMFCLHSGITNLSLYKHWVTMGVLKY